MASYRIVSVAIGAIVTMSAACVFAVDWIAIIAVSYPVGLGVA
jgi:hypothetical protein